ncbi:hypothetical protein C1N70_26535 (plasmid) [Cytobacillus firmus]|uniref:Uncharacterized protein n=1 Tax=Cytobacillus firmus DS1 TaxID=1307436 RepID=W7KNC0_CYTFI|nr:hypothetical protein PBF_21503 [Cytobacillus firmus DS1]
MLFFLLAGFLLERLPLMIMVVVLQNIKNIGRIIVMTKTCMEKDCQFGGLVQEINDGQTVKVLCGVHSIMYALNESKLTYKKGYPLKSELKEQADCSCCNNLAINMIEHLPTENTQWTLCETHLKKLLTHSLSPKEFHQLYNQYGDVYLLHDDFYDPETGIAFQQIE